MAMSANERRERILALLHEGDRPISASVLAEKMHVSRQVIVGDIALLRASNCAILATPRGYILHQDRADDEFLYTIACRHDSTEGLADELYTIVDNGGEVVDVIVEHPLYGQIAGKLHIASRFDVENFLQKLSGHAAAPLCDLTGGVHLHTLRCPSQEIFDRIVTRLREKGLLFAS